MTVHRIILVCIALAFSIAYVKSQERCNPPRPIPPAFWRNDTNCLNGPTYKATHQDQTFHCNCWGHCGYFCNVWNGGGSTRSTTMRTTTTTRGTVPTTRGTVPTTRGTVPTTRIPTTTRNPCINRPYPVPPSFWRDDISCVEGSTYKAQHDSLTFRCRCWGHCGYVCDLWGGVGTTRRTTTRRASSTTRRGSSTTTGSPKTTGKQSPCVHGPIWFPPNSNLRCYCQSHSQRPYYVCKPIASSTTEEATTTPEASTPEASTTQEATTTTGAPSTAETSPPTEASTTTEAATTTEATTTTEASTTTEAATTTEAPTTAEASESTSDSTSEATEATEATSETASETVSETETTQASTTQEVETSEASESTQTEDTQATEESTGA